MSMDLEKSTSTPRTPIEFAEFDPAVSKDLLPEGLEADIQRVTAELPYIPVPSIDSLMKKYLGLEQKKVSETEYRYGHQHGDTHLYPDVVGKELQVMANPDTTLRIYELIRELQDAATDRLEEGRERPSLRSRLGTGATFLTVGGLAGSYTFNYHSPPSIAFTATAASTATATLLTSWRHAAKRKSTVKTLAGLKNTATSERVATISAYKCNSPNYFQPERDTRQRIIVLADKIKATSSYRHDPSLPLTLATMLLKYAPTAAEVEGKIAELDKLWEARKYIEKSEEGRAHLLAEKDRLRNEISDLATRYNTLEQDLDTLLDTAESSQRLLDMYDILDQITDTEADKGGKSELKNDKISLDRFKGIAIAFVEAYLWDIPKEDGCIDQSALHNVSLAHTRLQESIEAAVTPDLIPIVKKQLISDLSELLELNAEDVPIPDGAAHDRLTDNFRTSIRFVKSIRELADKIQELADQFGVNQPSKPRNPLDL